MFRLIAWTMWPCICLPYTFETLGKRFHCNFWQEGVKKYQSFRWIYLTSKTKEVWTTKFHFPIHVQSRPSMTISGLIKTSTEAVGGSVVLKQTVLRPGLYHSWKICFVADEIGFVWISDSGLLKKKRGVGKKMWSAPEVYSTANTTQELPFRNACSLLYIRVCWSVI